MSANMGQFYTKVNAGDITGSTTHPQRQPQVSEAYIALEHALEVAQKTCAEMEQRLKLLLRNEPEATGDSQKEAQTLVPMAAQVQSYVRQLQQIERNYQSILRRLEL